jgi:hypothetical protein
MTLPDQDRTKDYIGRTVVDRNGADIGVCAALLLDATTGLPEWIYVERAEVTLIVPLLEAHVSGGRVHVTVTRAHADGAPRFSPTDELSRDQEAALYRHYGIEYSTATSDSILPAEARPTDAVNAGSAPKAAARRLVPSVAGRGRAIAAAVAAVAGLTAAVVAAVHRRRGTSRGSKRFLRRGASPRRPAARRVLAVPTAARIRAVQVAAAARPLMNASGRLARSGASASTASVRRAAVDVVQRSRTAATAARTYTGMTGTRLAPLLATAAHAASRAVRAVTDVTLRVTDAAAEAVVAAVPRMTAGTARALRTSVRAVLTVGAAAEAVPEVVAETGERLEKRWRRVMGKFSLGLGFGVGYVLGARAGRARYEQIRQAAAGFMERPEVQQALERARIAAPASLQDSIDKLSRRGSGRQDISAETIDGDAVLADESDIVAPPPPPVSSTGGPPGTDAPLPDPLIPPAKSVDPPTARP